MGVISKPLDMKKTFFNHDSSARNDYRIIKLRARLGYEGYGIFWAVLEILFTEENKLCIDEYEELAFGLQCDSKVLKHVIEDFDLFVLEDNCFYSRRLNNQIEEINSKSKKAKENATKRWNATAMQPHSNGNASKVKYSKADKSKSNQSISIQERSERFKQQLEDIEGIDKEDKENFFLYWTEPNKSQTKMRWELEKTWNLTLRLKRWARHNFSSNGNNNSKHPDYYDSQYERKLDAGRVSDYHKHLKSLGWTTSYSPAAGMVWTKRK